MKHRRLLSIVVTTAAVAVISTLGVAADQAGSAGGGASREGGSLKTPWGEPDLQGIWTGRTLTPLQRPARWADRPVLTPEEAAKVAEWVSGTVGRDDRSKRGHERDVAGAYNQFWSEDPRPQTLADGRTSLIIDPADGRIPPMTAEAKQRTASMQAYLDALLEGTSSGTPGSKPSPLRNQQPPMYNHERMNRTDGPEDRSVTERCFGSNMPNFGAYYRIVQSPGQVAIYHDSGQGQGFIRVIPVDGSAHPPSDIRFLHGDSRGRWEGDTLVVSVSNFTNKMQYQGARENLRLTERFKRVSENRIDYQVTLEDPTTWTKPWTIAIPWMREQDGVYESTCHEGNFGMVGMLANTRAAEERFAKGLGPDPNTEDNATGGGTDPNEHTVANFPR